MSVTQDTHKRSKQLKDGEDDDGEPIYRDVDKDEAWDDVREDNGEDIVALERVEETEVYWIFHVLK